MIKFVNPKEPGQRLVLKKENWTKIVIVIYNLYVSFCKYNYTITVLTVFLNIVWLFQ